MTDAELDAELEKGDADLKEGRTRLAKEVFDTIRRDHGDLWENRRIDQ